MKNPIHSYEVLVFTNQTLRIIAHSTSEWAMVTVFSIFNCLFVCYPIEVLEMIKTWKILKYKQMAKSLFDHILLFKSVTSGMSFHSQENIKNNQRHN